MKGSHLFRVEEEYAPQFDGVIVMKDLETFSDIAGSQVILFDESKDSLSDLEKVFESGDISAAFDAALEGRAEVIKLENLVEFYLQNN